MGKFIYKVSPQIEDKRFSVAEVQARMKIRSKAGYSAVALASLLRDYGKMKQSGNNQELYRNFMMDLDCLMIEIGSIDKQTLINKAHIAQYAPLAMDEVKNFIQESKRIENMKTVAFANIYKRFKEALWNAI